MSFVQRFPVQTRKAARLKPRNPPHGGLRIAPLSHRDLLTAGVISLSGSLGDSIPSLALDYFSFLDKSSYRAGHQR